MKDSYQRLHDHYQSASYYARANVLDGKFEGMMLIYEAMYGQYMPPDKDAIIADIACGAGQFLKYCLNKGYSRATGVDLSKEQIEYANKYVTSNAYLMDGFDYLDSNPNVFDLVVANDFIEHLTKENGIIFVGLVHQALKPGGRIILKTGNMAAFGGLVMLYNTLDHECGYTENSLRTLLAIGGFEQIEIIPYMMPTNTIKRLRQQAFHKVLGMMYKYFYAGNYPKYYTKIIAVTGVRSSEVEPPVHNRMVAGSISAEPTQ